MPKWREEFADKFSSVWKQMLNGEYDDDNPDTAEVSKENLASSNNVADEISWEEEQEENYLDEPRRSKRMRKNEKRRAAALLDPSERRRALAQKRRMHHHSSDDDHDAEEDSADEDLEKQLLALRQVYASSPRKRKRTASPDNRKRKVPKLTV
eukprot:TRINITY_DN12037_c0_g1_i1.p1 TRINITY_DN12037_c0_g1~~TRINITY_DN12037_c0_g1_i1.p1  ORF type:complete len:153 (+),score=46.01 TRINITY_DN12037_c0_g1_i1:1-459(+)